MNNPIQRDFYLSQLRNFEGKNLIKVLTGMRRSGKSTILKMFADELYKKGAKNDQIISINFENMEYRHLLTADRLYEHIQSLLTPKGVNYVFLDEIQKVV